MSDLNDLFKQLAEEKAKDPKYQQQVKIKESVKGDLNSLFSTLAEEKAKDPKVIAAKKLEKDIKENVKTDLGSLFAELASLKKQKEELIEEHPQLIEEVIEETVEFTPELVEEVITEVAPLPTPIGNVPTEVQIPDIDKYLKAPKQPQQEEPAPYSKEFKTVNDKIKFLEQWIGKIQNAGPGSGEVNLRYLDDVDRSSIGVGKYLTYNPTTKKFYFEQISVEGGIPQVQSDWNETEPSSLSFINNKPDLFSGSYDDLTDKPNAIDWTNSSPSPSTNFKTVVAAGDGIATITFIQGVPGYGEVNQWRFDKDKITYPDGSLQTTAWTGTYSYNNLTDKPTIPSLTGYATESFVNTAITNVVGAAPDALNTLKEIADQLASDESAVSSLTTTVAGKVSLTGSYANPAWITSLAYGKLTGSPTNVSSFTNDSGYLSSVSWSQVTDKPQNIVTLNDTNVITNDMLVNKSITIGDVTVTLGQVITALTGLTGVTSNGATAFIAGPAAESNVALQMPRESALRNLTNGFSNMYFDVSIGGTAQGAFQFRSSNGYTNVLTMSPTVVTFNTGATVTARTASMARTGFNAPIDTEIIVDELRFRISNQGGIFPQVIGHGSSRNLAWTGVGAISGTAVTQVGSTGTIVASNAWTTLYNAHGMDSAGDTITVTLQDKAGSRIYRITFMRSDNGSTTGYNIIAERLM